ncbi:MAG TPA: helix-turn-helix transcriptional regulator [Polyangiaceae bacterium]
MKLELSFGVVIKRRRLALGVSQEQLAIRTSQYKSNVCDHERGFHVPSLVALIAYADALDCTLLELIAEAQRNADPSSALSYTPAYEAELKKA